MSLPSLGAPGHSMRVAPIRANASAWGQPSQPNGHGHGHGHGQGSTTPDEQPRQGMHRSPSGRWLPDLPHSRRSSGGDDSKRQGAGDAEAQRGWGAAASESDIQHMLDSARKLAANTEEGDDDGWASFRAEHAQPRPSPGVRSTGGGSSGRASAGAGPGAPGTQSSLRYHSSESSDGAVLDTLRATPQNLTPATTPTKKERGGGVFQQSAASASGGKAATTRGATGAFGVQEVLESQTPHALPPPDPFFHFGRSTGMAAFGMLAVSLSACLLPLGGDISSASFGEALLFGIFGWGVPWATLGGTCAELVR